MASEHHVHSKRMAHHGGNRAGVRVVAMDACQIAMLLASLVDCGQSVTGVLDSPVRELTSMRPELLLSRRAGSDVCSVKHAVQSSG